MRPPESHRHAESLAGAYGDVCTKLSRRPQEGQGQQIRRHDDQNTGLVSLFNERLIIANIAVGGRILQQQAAQPGIVKIDRLRGPDMHSDIVRFRPGL